MTPFGQATSLGHCSPQRNHEFQVLPIYISYDVAEPHEPIRPRHSMSDRAALLAKITQQHLEEAEVAVSLEDFFTGNDDPGSIGANLGEEQPPLDSFYQTLRAIRARESVQDVLVRIHSVEEDTWPYTDTVYIISSASQEEIETWVSP